MNKLILLFLVFIGCSVQAGVPVKYFNCPDKALKIQEPAESQGYFFDKDCQNVYVKPPIEGVMKFSSYVSASTDKDCKSNMAVINMINDQRKRNQIAYANLKKAYKNLEKKNRKIVSLKRKCDAPNSRLNNLKGKDNQLNIRLGLANKNLNVVKEAFRACSNPEKNSNCRELKNELKELNEELGEIINTKRENDRSLRSAEGMVQLCESHVNTEIARIQTEDKNFREATLELQIEADELKKLLNREAKPLMSEVGGQIAVSFLSKHNALVEKFKNLNKGLGVNFVAIPIQNAVIHFDKVDQNSQDQFPVQLRTNISGLVSADPEEGIAPENLVSKGSVSFGEGAGGSIIINKYTACSLVDNSSASSREERLEDIINTLKPTVTFGYEVQVVRKVAVKYNESHLYQLIKKFTSKSGLFRSSSSASITEKTNADKWIEINISAEDERVQFENAEKLMMDLRKEYLDAALIKVARSYLSEQQLQTKDPGSDGATKAAKELRENCPYSYCQAAAVVLNIGSALFGGSTSEANMSKIVSAQENVNLISELPVKEYGQQTLKVVKE